MTPEALRASLDAADITTGELARRLGVNPRTVRRWVSGEYEIPEGAADDIAAALDPEAVKRCPCCGAPWHND